VGKDSSYYANDRGSWGYSRRGVRGQPPFLKFFQFASGFLRKKNPKVSPRFSRPYKKFQNPPRKISGYTFVKD